jgi:hypothetical protein
MLATSLIPNIHKNAEDAQNNQADAWSLRETADAHAATLGLIVVPALLEQIGSAVLVRHLVCLVYSAKLSGLNN